MNSSVRYVIFGAGAIGIVVGGLLQRAGARVAFIARPTNVAALKSGITLKERDHEVFVQSDAASLLREIEPADCDIVFLAAKSQATEATIEELASVYRRTTPIVCLQNGTRNEALAAVRFDHVYAALVMLSAVQLQPEIISLPRGRGLAIGCYPQGLDETAQQICSDLKEAGIEAMASAYTMSMKWGKLVANLNNATHTITDYWVELGMADPEMRRLTLAVREEGLRVLDAAGIAVEPPAGEPSALRIREMTEALKGEPKFDFDPRDLPTEKRMYASMWQDLHLGRSSHEAEFLNGEIIALGRKLGIPTPYNTVLLHLINRMFTERLRPGILSPAQLHEQIRRYAAGQ